MPNQDCVKEKLRLVHEFLHVDARDQLNSLEKKMKSSEISMVSKSLGVRMSNCERLPHSFCVTRAALSSQEGYISKVKALLGNELCLENGSHADGTKQNGKTNGFSTNGSHKDEDGGDEAMDVHKEADALKSPTVSKGKGGRKSKADSDAKSKLDIHLYFVSSSCIPQRLLTSEMCLYFPESPVGTRVTRNSGKQPTIMSMFSKVCVYAFHLVPQAFLLSFLKRKANVENNPIFPCSQKRKSEDLNGEAITGQNEVKKEEEENDEEVKHILCMCFGLSNTLRFTFHKLWYKTLITSILNLF